MLVRGAFSLAALLVSGQITGVNAQGGGQVGAGVPTSTGEIITSGTHSTQSSLPTESTGPWADLEHLIGTWSSKSQMVMTGPDFYDPVDELLIEPALPGLSYSFTKDGFFEEAIYQVSSNPAEPKCPSGALTFQHGTYNITSNNKLMLYPFEDDGRQLVSEPCKYNESQYVRYSQKEEYSKFSVELDMYYGRYRLDLYQFDGTPMTPMYLAYNPPQMLPTQTLNPTSAGEGSSSSKHKRSSVDLRERVKRSLINRDRTNAVREKHPQYDNLWWLGVSLMTAGTVGYIWLS